MNKGNICVSRETKLHMFVFQQQELKTDADQRKLLFEGFSASIDGRGYSRPPGGGHESLP